MFVSVLNCSLHSLGLATPEMMPPTFDSTGKTCPHTAGVFGKNSYGKHKYTNGFLIEGEFQISFSSFFVPQDRFPTIV